jgi:hypothetical protein
MRPTGVEKEANGRIEGVYATDRSRKRSERSRRRVHTPERPEKDGPVDKTSVKKRFW